MSNIRILVADDHELVRRGLISILARSHPEWEIVGEVSNGLAAVELGAVVRPDLAILDLTMPQLDGLQTAERLVEAVPGIRILILTMHAAAPIFRHLQKVRVSAYLAKSEAPRKLVDAVERVLAGEPFFASDSTLRSGVEAPEYVPAQFLLSPREVEVLRLLARGRSNKELAAELSMSVRTAESHRANLLAKLHVESIGELVRIAMRDGIV